MYVCDTPLSESSLTFLARSCYLTVSGYELAAQPPVSAEHLPYLSLSPVAAQSWSEAEQKWPGFAF